MHWTGFPEGVFWIGHSGPDFCFDNERPRHRVFLENFHLASRLVTNGEYVAFIEDHGYERPELWLSLGWFTVNEQNWKAPLYWAKQDGEWLAFTLAGVRKIDPAEPVCHVSYFEADAYARWAGARLPTEAEWEIASENVPLEGNFAEQQQYHPIAAPAPRTGQVAQMFGDVWEWTRSSYAPYPRYEPASGAIGEYNGKFMCNQYVLRGGSCLTPAGHVRASYRNFFPPEAQWQASGLRLAR
jgi:ergothioneine biosynthesis protein EgtB